MANGNRSIQHGMFIMPFLDHLSKGRLNLCFGPGSVTADHELYGLDMKSASAMVEEATEIIFYLWSHDPPYQYDGEFWKIRLEKTVEADCGLGFIHRPYQQPYPPHFLSGVYIRNHWKTYSDGATSAGRTPDPSDRSVARNIVVADTTERARQFARHGSMGKCIEYILELTRRGPGLKFWKCDPAMTDSECNRDYFLDEVIIASDPDEVTRRLIELRQSVGEFGTLVLVAHDWDDRQRWLHSLELFAHEVVPALN